MKPKSIPRNVLLALLGLYVVVLIYFMLFGFGRIRFLEAQEYRYSFIPFRIPLWLPRSFSFDTLKIWSFAFCNLIAFIPIGILLPAVSKRKFNTYIKFIFLFLGCIIFMEVIQMITYLGSFDVEDIMINAMGATIGFYSYKIGKRADSYIKKSILMALSVVGFTIFVFLIARVYNSLVTPILQNIFEVV